MSDYGAPDQPSQRHRRSERTQSPQTGMNAPYVQPVAPSSSQAKYPLTQPLQPYGSSQASWTAPQGFPQTATGSYPVHGTNPPQGDWRQFSYDTAQQPWTTQPVQPYQSSGSGQIPPTPRRPIGSSSHGGYGGPPSSRWPLLLLVLLAIVVIVLAAIHIGGQIMANNQLHDYVSAYDYRFCEGVYVDGIHLGGMSQEEGFSAVSQQAQRRNDSWYVTLTYNGQAVSTFNAKHLGMTADINDAMTEAWAQGHTGSLQQRKDAMDALVNEPWHGYTALPSGNTDAVDNILAQLHHKLNYSPQNAVLVAFDPSQPSNPFIIQPEINGSYLDTNELKTRIYQMVSTMESGSLPLTPVVVPASVTEAQLRQQLAQRSDTYTKISTTSTEYRTNNIIRAFEKINGTVLAPGETFSFNETVGKRTLQNGFYPAIEYANREEVEGIGGGVCQASTTLYIAAVQAGLQIVKREPHSDKVNYTDYGKDATVYWESRKIDFSFKNNTGSNIYLMTSVQSDPNNKHRLVARVTIYGESLGPNTRYDIVTETVETLPVPLDPVRKKDKDAKYVVYEDEEYRIAGDMGYVVQSYRVKYVNNVEVERVALYKDRYEPKSDVVYYGATKRPTE